MLFSSDRIVKRIFALSLFAFLHVGWGHEVNVIESPAQGSVALASAILNKHPYLLNPEQRGRLKQQVGEAEEVLATDLPDGAFEEMLESVDSKLVIDLEENPDGKDLELRSFSLPGDRGGILYKIVQGAGSVSFKMAAADLSRLEKTIAIPTASNGTTWTLLSLSHMPDGLTHMYTSFPAKSGKSITVPLEVIAPKMGRLRFKILSDDTGEVTPAMVRLKWSLDNSDRAPDSALDLTEQFDSQGSSRKGPAGSMPLKTPGREEGNYWITPGEVDMLLPPGGWKISILRGVEHTILDEEVVIVSGEILEKVYRPIRWVDMKSRDWYSGDDHVHARIQNERDAKNLRIWGQAEDVNVLNILEMGDHERTFFQQREFGVEGRSRLGDTILVPGQEDPRIADLGHTIALNISEAVRDTSRYYLHDWYHARVRELGGLYGYAHVNREMFNIHRDMSLNVIGGKVDFVELLQFHQLGTKLYYNFLNLGEKLTAAAGSDVPWGGSVGEVRMYGYIGDENFTSDAWFKAVEDGRTFVTNGPMIEFSVDAAMPGDEISLGNSKKKVTVKARAWGHPDRLLPTRLEIVRHGDVIRTSKGSGSHELSLEFELDPGQGCWLAARAFANDGSLAHTTPIYLKRPNLRFWNHDEVPSLIDQQLDSLVEVEKLAVTASRPDLIDREEGTGSLIGIWYGESDFTRPRGMDFFGGPEQAWPAAGVRGGFWSVRWSGTITLPDEYTDGVAFHIESSGPSTLTIDGEDLLSSEERGEMQRKVNLKPGVPHEIGLTYSNTRVPRSYLNFYWSAPGEGKQLVPSEWLGYRKEDHSAAIVYSTRVGVEQSQLEEQSEALLARVEKARSLYRKLREQWSKELRFRE